MLPYTLFFEAAEKAFDETVLLGCIRRNEFLAQTIIAAGGTKTPALKNQSIIRAHHRGWTGRAQRPEARQAGFLERAFGFLGAATSSWTISRLDNGGHAMSFRKGVRGANLVAD